MPLVPLLTNSGPTASVYAPASVTGGGGGGSGPNPSVSSISISTSINMSGLLSINDPTTAVATDFFFVTGSATPPDFASSFVSTTNSFIVNGPGGDVASGQLSFSGSADGRGMILQSLENTGDLSTLSIVADNVIMPQNLQVSSINGAAPGGGGSGPNLTVSTLTVNDSGQINFDNQLLMKSSGNGYALITKANDNTNLSVQSTDGNSVVFLGAANGLAGGYIATAYNQPLSIQPITTISSLNVSSINGAAPGGGGSGPNLTVSSLTLPPYTSPTSGSINFLGGIAITEATAPTGNPEYFFDPNKPTTGNYSLVSTFASSITAFNIQEPFPAGGNITIASADNGTALIFTSAPTSTLVLLADPVKIPGDLQVSSLNSGSVGTLAIGGSVVIFNDLACSSLSTNAIAPVSGTIVTISSISVSSINGVAPGGGGSLYPVVSTISPGGGGAQTQYFTSTGQDIQVLTAFSTQVGHNYQLSIPFTISTFSVPAYGDTISFTSQGAGASNFQYTLPLIQGGSWNFPVSFKNKVADSGAAIVLTTNTAYAVEVNLGDADGAELVDLGPST